MKEIKAVIRPNKLPALREALMATPGFPGMTVTRVEGCSAPGRHVSHQRLKDELTEYSQKVRIEIIAPDEVAARLFDSIVNVAQTGHYGDGLVWMTTVERATFVFKEGERKPA